MGQQVTQEINKLSALPSSNILFKRYLCMYTDSKVQKGLGKGLQYPVKHSWVSSQSDIRFTRISVITLWCYHNSVFAIWNCNVYVGVNQI